MLPLAPHNRAPGPGELGTPVGQYLACPPSLQLGSGMSSTAVPAPCSTALSETNLWGPSPTQKSITAALWAGGHPHHPSHGHSLGATAPFCPPSSCTQPALLLLHTPSAFPR